MEFKTTASIAADAKPEPDLKQGSGDELKWIKPIPKELIEENTGICPFPPQFEIDNFIMNYTLLINMNKKSDGSNLLHTNDRHNLKAISEKLTDMEELGSMDFVQLNYTWAGVVQSNFNI